MLAKFIRADLFVAEDFDHFFDAVEVAVGVHCFAETVSENGDEIAWLEIALIRLELVVVHHADGQAR